MDNIYIVRNKKKNFLSEQIKSLYRVLYRLLAVFLFLLLWEVISRLKLVNSIFLPPFTKVLEALYKLALSGELVKHLSVSLWRSLMGFTLGLGFAIPFGLAIGWFRKFERFIDPLIQLFRNLPVLALLPVFVMIFGIGEISKIAVIFWGVLWSVLLNTIAGVKSVEPQLIKAARSMGTPGVVLFIRVILPGALPSIFTGIRISATTSILILIAAEMIGASRGLGYALYFYQANFKTPEMYSIIVIMALLGLSINYLLINIEATAFRWKEKIGSEGK